MRLDKKHQREIVSMLDPPFNFGEDYQSFIVVRRTGVMSSDFNPPLVIDSTRRAQRIAALLGLVLLAENSYGETCCLIEQLHRREFRIGMIDTDENCFRYQGGGSSSNTICSPERNYNLSRDELRKVISKEPFRALASVLLPQRPPIPRALRKSIDRSPQTEEDGDWQAEGAGRGKGAGKDGGRNC